MIERIPSYKTIEQAKEQQAIGNYAIARALVSSIERYPVSRFSRLSTSTKTRFMRAAIIHTNSSINRAENSWTALEVAANLAKAKKIIVNIYNHASVQKAAQTFKEDTDRNSCEFSVEMGREKISYLLTLAALTGNNAYIIRAIEDMNSLIERAEEPTTKTLLHFERQRLLHRQAPTSESFDSLTQAFRQATDASLIAGDWKSVAEISVRYTIDAKKMGIDEEVTNGERMYNYAADYLSPSTPMAQEIEKKEQNEDRRSKWSKVKPKEEEYSFLDLPR